MHFPYLPSWDAIHPLVIHFPIVLLLLAPLFIVIAAALRPPRNAPYMVTAITIMLLGTAGLFAAASSGEEAAELADRNDAVSGVLALHERLALNTEIAFSILLVTFVTLFLWTKIKSTPETRVTSTVFPLVFLAAYGIGLLFLVNTAHAGGRLVHEFGVHAMLPQSTPSVPEQTPPRNEDKD